MAGEDRNDNGVDDYYEKPATSLTAAELRKAIEIARAQGTRPTEEEERTLAQRRREPLRARNEQAEPESCSALNIGCQNRNERRGFSPR